MLGTDATWPPDLDCYPLNGAARVPVLSEVARAGFFNPTHPNPVSVCGSAAVSWAQNRDASRVDAALQHCAAVLLDPQAATCEVLRAAVRGMDAWHCAQSAHVVVASLRRWASQRRPAAIRHGVLVEVGGLGVLIEGPSAAGKSALALRLLSRGHRLVADDAVEMRRLAPDLLVGACPRALAGLLHVRDLGVARIPSLYRATACRGGARVDLVVRIAPGPSPVLSADELLEGRRGQVELEGAMLPCITLPSSADASLVETACREHWMRLDGLSSLDALQTLPPAAAGQAM